MVPSFESPFTLLSSCLWWILGRKLKGAAQTRTGEEQHPLALWGPAEQGERSRMKDVILEPGSATARAQCED